MATTIRLQRHGRKKRAFFHIVVTDSRAPRDGKYIEKLGSYNPITNPATISLDLDGAVKWLMTGAQASDTARAILSYKGALYKQHLQVGVNKGAITQEQADAKFAEWASEKEAKVQSKRDGLAAAKNDKRSAAMKAETARKAANAAKILAKTSELAAEAEAAANAESAASEVVETVDTVETPIADAVETPEVDVVETPEADVVETPEADVADVVETPEVETTPEVEEPAADITPAADNSESGDTVTE